MAHPVVLPSEAFKALGDPVRWSILRQLTTVDAISFSSLEDVLSISKAALSYHTRILAHAGLISVHKRGRNYFYSLRRDVVRQLVQDVRLLVPARQAAVDGASIAERAG